MKRFFVAVCLLALSFLSYAQGTASFELDVTWRLKYGILRESGAVRGERPEGYISDFIVKEDETVLELKNFYCVKAIQQTVCPVIFYDRNEKIISYVKFVKSDKPSDYKVNIPKNCYKYQLSTERIKDFGPVVYCDRKKTSSEMGLKRTAVTPVQQKLIDSGVASLKKSLTARKVMYTMPVDTTGRYVVYTKGRMLSQVISECEKQYSGRRIKVIIDSPMNLEKTDVIDCSRNTYVIRSAYPVTGLQESRQYQLSGGVLKIRRPAGLSSVDCVLVDGERFTWVSRFNEEDPDTFPTFNSKSIKFLGEQSGSYVYSLNLKPGHGITRSSVVKLYTEWISIYARVVSVQKNSVQIATNTKLSEFIVDKTYPVSLYNVYNNQADASVGEYWYDDQYIYCRLARGARSPKSVQVAVNNTLFRVASAANVTFADVKFCHTAASDIYSYSEQGMMNGEGTVAVEKSHDIHFIDCEFWDTGDYCVSFRTNTSHCSVQGCYLHDLGSGGIIVNNPKMPWQKGYKLDDTKQIMIYSNIIRGYGKLRPCGVGILAGFGNDISIISNHVFDGYYTGISLGWGWNQYHLNKNNYVAGNTVHHIMKFLLCDGGGIYTLSDWDGGSVECNEVYCVNTRSRRDCALGIYHDQGSANILDYGNSVYACDVANGSCYKNGWVLDNNYSCIGSTVLEERADKENLTSFPSGNKIHQFTEIRTLKPGNKDYSGKVIPAFKSRYADMTKLSDEYLAHYKDLYNKMSLNRNNPYFR